MELNSVCRVEVPVQDSDAELPADVGHTCGCVAVFAQRHDISYRRGYVIFDLILEIPVSIQTDDLVPMVQQKNFITVRIVDAPSQVCELARSTSCPSGGTDYLPV